MGPGLFAGHIRHFRRSIIALCSFSTLARLAAGTRAGSTTAARSSLCLRFFLDSNFSRGTFDHGLRTGTVFDNGCRNLGSFRHLRCDRSFRLDSPRFGRTFATLCTLATFRAILATITAIVAVTAVFARLLVLATTALLGILLTTLLRLLLFDHRLRSITQIVAVTAVEIVLIDNIAIAILEFAAILMLEAILHLGLRSCDYAVVMLCVLQIVFCNNTVAGALRIAGKSRIFFCYMLGSTADFYIRSGTVISAAERIAALALEIVITTTAAAVIVVTTPSTTLVLLSWPHLSFTNSLSSLIRGHAARRSKPVQDFACYVQVDQRGLPLSKSNYLIHASRVLNLAGSSKKAQLRIDP